MLKTILDSLDAFVYVAGMETYEVLFINKYGQNMLGKDITGAICWQTIQDNQTGPCPFCTNRFLVTPEGKPAEVYTWEFQNTITGRWLHIHDRAITWTDGRLVRLEIATDITARRQQRKKAAEMRTGRMPCSPWPVSHGPPGTPWPITPWPRQCGSPAAKWAIFISWITISRRLIFLPGRKRSEPNAPRQNPSTPRWHRLESGPILSASANR